MEGTHLHTDEQLVLAARSGDRDAFAELYDRHFGPLYDFLARLLRDRDEAADVAQEAFLRAIERLDQLRRASAFKSWLFSIAYRLGIDRIGQQKQIEPIGLSGDHSASPFVAVDPERLSDPEQATSAAETGRFVWEAAAGLDRRTYAVMHLHVREGLESGEIAEVMGVTKPNAYAMVSRMKRTLARTIGTYLLVRHGVDQCDDLERLVGETETAELTPALRHKVDRHVGDCQQCTETRAALVRPERIFSGLALVPVPIATKGAILALVGQQTGVAVGSAAGAGSTGSATTTAQGGGGLLGGTQAMVTAGIVSLVVVVGGAVLAVTMLRASEPTEPTVLGIELEEPTPSGIAEGVVAAPAESTTTVPTTSTTTMTSTTTTTAPTVSPSTTAPRETSPVSTSTSDRSLPVSTLARTAPASSPTTIAPVPEPPIPPITPPAAASDPGDVASTSHQPGVASTDPVVAMTWTPVPNAAGYSVSWTQSATSLPDAVVDLPGDATGTASAPLPPGTWWFHLRTQGPGGDWTSTVHAGPYPITPAASDPGDVASTSHQPGVASTDPVVAMTWTPVPNAAGYSVSWTQSATSLPDAVVDLPGDATGTASAPLPPGTWWFHLRTQGPGGDWTSTVHAGPYPITPAASDPGDVASTSHQPGVASTDPVVAMTWTPVPNAAGYSVSWTQSATSLPDAVVDLPGDATGTASAPLPPGTWWFHLRTQGPGGDWTSTVHAGPYPITPAASDPGDVASTSHQPGVASTDPVVAMTWTPVPNAAGYSVSWTQSATSLPDAVVDLPGDATGTASAPLPPGTWWFHLRTQGPGGDWTSTVHAGPYPITPAASDPGDVASTSHQPGVASTDPVVAMTWTPVPNAAGYSVSWTQSATSLPDAVVDLPGDATGTASAPLPPGTWWFHLRTQGPGGDWTSTVHAGPYPITPAASDPGDVASTSHQPGVASTDPVVAMTWTPVPNAAGYSVSWTQSATSLPDAVVDLPGDATGTASAPLPPGTWWFHLRTQGPGGDWTSTVHAGPYPITPAASDPGDVASTSHQPGVASTDPVVAMTWTPVPNAAGYSVSWTQSATSLPDAVVDLPGDATGTASAPLPPGTWWFHLRTQGPGGDWTSTVHAGPYPITPAASDPGDVASTSHQPGVASTDPVVAMTWTPVPNAAGYSVSWTQSATSLPDAVVDLPGDATGTASAPLPPGTWWFHLRTQGPGGDWTSTVHAGPYPITPAGQPPVIRDVNVNPTQISETGAGGARCGPGPQESQITAVGVTDPDGGIASVTLTWRLDGARNGLSPMNLQGQSATARLSFAPDTISAAESPASIQITVTATDDTGLAATTSPVTLTLVDCPGVSGSSDGGDTHPETDVTTDIAATDRRPTDQSDIREVAAGPDVEPPANPEPPATDEESAVEPNRDPPATIQPSSPTKAPIDPIEEEPAARPTPQPTDVAISATDEEPPVEPNRDPPSTIQPSSSTKAPPNGEDDPDQATDTECLDRKQGRSRKTSECPPEDSVTAAEDDQPVPGNQVTGKAGSKRSGAPTKMGGGPSRKSGRHDS